MAKRGEAKSAKSREGGEIHIWGFAGKNICLMGNRDFSVRMSILAQYYLPGIVYRALTLRVGYTPKLCKAFGMESTLFH